jgi:hypothetical protein
MFATKLPCLCWQGARIISPGGECALEPARAVKPGCFVAPSIVRSLACDALRCDAMRCDGLLGAALSRARLMKPIIQRRSMQHRACYLARWPRVRCRLQFIV